MADVMRRTLFIMAKAPFIGQVKTRLAGSIGAVQAAQFYRTMSNAVISRLGSDPRWQTIIAVAPDDYRDTQKWPLDIERIGQGRGNLGKRMQRILDCSSPGSVVTDQVLIIGTDIPSIMPHHIDKAFKMLGRYDVVFGPANDGGYWLVGSRRIPRVPRLFANVRWSTSHALEDTMFNAAKLNVGLCDKLNDVDDLTDYKKWRAMAPRLIQSSSYCAANAR